MSITLPETKNHGWIDASTERGLAATKGIGQVKNPNRPMSVSNLSDGRHATCVDHVEVAELREKLCIPRGADRQQLIREAIELAGG